MTKKDPRYRLTAIEIPRRNPGVIAVEGAAVVVFEECFAMGGDVGFEVSNCGPVYISNSGAKAKTMISANKVDSVISVNNEHLPPDGE